jgi:hypothetical protein
MQCLEARAVVKKPEDQYTPEEAKKRMEAALRGARIAGHKSMADIQSKPKPHKSGKIPLPKPQIRPK